MTTFLRWTARVILGIFAFLVLVYLVQGLWGTARLHGAKGDAEETVRALQRDTGLTDQAVKDNRAALGEPERSWGQVVCELRSRDAGWVVQDYAQQCEWQHVAIYPATVQRRAERLDDPVGSVRVKECDDVDCLPEPQAAPTGEGIEWWAGTEPVWFAQSELGDGRYTVVTTSGPQSTTELGCNPWVLPFCTEPVDHPVMPQA